LCEDEGKAIVSEYYQKTGFFQPNHHVIVQNRILRDHPWVALELFNAFRRSKEIAYERARRYESTYLYFPGKNLAEQRAISSHGTEPEGVRVFPKATRRYLLSDDTEDLRTLKT
jgi:hypothetical protein